MDFESETLVAHSLRGGGFDASEDGTGRGTPLVPEIAGTMPAAGATERKHGHGWGQQEFEAGHIVPEPQGVALRGRDDGATAELTGEVMTALRTGGGGGDKPHVLLPVDYTNGIIGGSVSGTIEAAQSKGNRGHGVALCFDETQITSIGILTNWRVRRLTPTECERLQGFPDGYTAIPYRGKPAADGPRYKALGNSMAVNVMRWIGTRMAMVEEHGTNRALETPLETRSGGGKLSIGRGSGIRTRDPLLPKQRPVR